MSPSKTPPGRLAGLHLMPVLALVETPRPSALAEVDLSGRVLRLDLLGGDAEIAAALPRAPGLVVVDAPAHVPNPTGRRAIEDLLAWCDIPLLPVARERLSRLYGGLRGEAVGAAIASAGHDLWETAPDAVLRQIVWERAESAHIELADYRERWIGVRAPRFRPSLTGRARPDGIRAAWEILASVLDLGDRRPAGDDDWSHIADAARVDALACAYAALRRATGRSVDIDAGAQGRMTLPADANLGARLELHAGRLRAEGTAVSAGASTA